MMVLKNHEQKLNYLQESLATLQQRMEENILSGKVNQANMHEVEVELNHMMTSVNRMNWVCRN